MRLESVFQEGFRAISFKRDVGNDILCWSSRAVKWAGLKIQWLSAFAGSNPASSSSDLVCLIQCIRDV